MKRLPNVVITLELQPLGYQRYITTKNQRCNFNNSEMLDQRLLIIVRVRLRFWQNGVDPT